MTHHPPTTESPRPFVVEIEIDGTAHPLRLTLGALAAIEAGLGGDALADLGARLSNPSARDVLVILRALLLGGGARMSLADLEAADIDIAAAAAAIARALAGFGDKADAGETPGKPTAPASRSPGATGSGGR